jgi:hypothetical protein
MTNRDFVPMNQIWSMVFPNWNGKTGICQIPAKKNHVSRPVDSIYLENGFPMASIKRLVIIIGLYLNQPEKTRNRKNGSLD